MDRVVDKTAEAQTTIPGKDVIRDRGMKPLTVTNSTPADLVRGGVGFVPIGYFRGGLAFWDLDKQVNQPLVDAERKHILGILDGREEGYDLKTLTVIALENAGTSHSGTLTVPVGQVWYINAVRMLIPASGGGNTVTGNWRCSLWADRGANPSTAGQAFHPVDLAGPVVQRDEFGWTANIFTTHNKQEALRLPALSSITFVVTNTVLAAAATVTATLMLRGYIGKTLII